MNFKKNQWLWKETILHLNSPLCLLPSKSMELCSLSQLFVTVTRLLADNTFAVTMVHDSGEYQSIGHRTLHWDD